MLLGHAALIEPSGAAVAAIVVDPDYSQEGDPVLSLWNLTSTKRAAGRAVGEQSEGEGDLYECCGA